MSAVAVAAVAVLLLVNGVHAASAHVVEIRGTRPFEVTVDRVVFDAIGVE